ncbi:MAG TPA: GNAT family N-acetyltransferase [Stellaceae bacterium]|nr:GNAT family N-acetyltransferase [Stellaceae bacterium]
MLRAASDGLAAAPSAELRALARAKRPIVLQDTWHDRDAWNGFVEAHEQSRFCHLFDYGEVVRCYGYKPVRLAFVSEGQLVAALPASLAESLIFGCKLVSQPFSEYGGLLVDPSLDADEIDRVYDLLDEHLGNHPKIRTLEMHGSHGIAPHQSKARLATQNPHHVAVLSLDHSLDALWNKVVEYSVRKGVNKAIANGVEVSEESSDAVIRERFFPLYLHSMKRLGAPPHSLAYFTRCRELLDDRMKIFWARRDGEFLAGLLGFTCGRRVNIISIVSNEAVWKFSPNDAVHWAFIKWAAESGFRFFDFGSVRYEGQRTYKKKWGTAFEDHAHYFLPADLETVNRSTFNSSSPRMSQLATLWSNHMPDRLAQLAGPVIRKHLVR